jgi:hypothetical protein
MQGSVQGATLPLRVLPYQGVWMECGTNAMTHDDMCKGTMQGKVE